MVWLFIELSWVPQPSWELGDQQRLQISCGYNSGILCLGRAVLGHGNIFLRCSGWTCEMYPFAKVEDIYFSYQLHPLSPSFYLPYQEFLTM